MPRALVVDDDPTVSEVVTAYLQRAGFDVDGAGTGLRAVELAAANHPDVVVLDLMLPGIDGLEVCRRLRLRDPGLPVIMLTARGEEEDRILGLEVGADDYVSKPFSPRELVLRVQSLLRRASATAPGDGGGTATSGGGRAPEVVTDGNLRLDRQAHTVTRDGSELALTAREFALLDWLLAHPATAYRRDEIMKAVWGWDFGDESTVTVHARRLREKVEADPSHPTRLVTVFGVGYRWDPTAADVTGIPAGQSSTGGEG